MRIITGKRRGLKLDAPKGDHTRPTESRIKESLFNILGNVSDSIVVDLFSGSGSIGLEFLSRDAKLVYLVDNDKEAISIIKKNIQKMKLDGTIVLQNDYNNALEDINSKGANIDYVYIDPPYDSNKIYENVLLKISKLENFKNSLLIVESSENNNIHNLELFDIIDKRKYRSTILYFLRRKI